MHIIGIAGRSGAGKHVVAASIAAVLDENGYSVKLDSFARDIKRAVRGEDGLIDKVGDRRMMQILGAEIRKRNPNRFVDDLAKRNNLLPVRWATWEDEPDFLIIADIRHENELRFCRERGVVIFVNGSFEPLTGAIAEHPSEYLAKTFRVFAGDFVIDKQSTPAKLAAVAAELVRTNLAEFLKEKEIGYAS